MDISNPQEEDKDLKSVGLELMFMTPEKCNSEDGITAVELAKRVNLPVDIVKKKLNILKEKDIVRVKGINQSIGSLMNIIFKEWMKMMKLICFCAVLMMLILTNIFRIKIENFCINLKLTMLL